MTTRVRILLSGFSRSGGGRVVLTYAAALVRAGWDVELVLPDYSSAPPPGSESHTGRGDIRVSSVVIHRRGKLGRLEYLYRLTRQRYSRAEVCIVGSFRLLVPVLLARVFGRGPVRIIFFAQHLSPLGWVPSSRLGRWAVGLVRAVLYRVPGVTYATVSEWLCRAAGGRRWIVIPNGVDGRLFRPRPRMVERGQRFRVGIIARPGPEKGLDVFEDALQLGREALAERVEIVVCSPEGEHLEVPTDYRVQHLGPLDHLAMPEFYNDLDAYVSPSRQEGFGLTPLEAMACGTPVILSDCAGHLGYASPSNAFLFRAGDSYGLLRALACAMEDDCRRTAIAHRARMTAQRFSAEASVRAFTSLVRSVSGSTDGGR